MFDKDMRSYYFLTAMAKELDFCWFAGQPKILKQSGIKYIKESDFFDESSWFLIKFIYSEKATKFYEISTLLLTLCTVVKSKVEISRNFVAFSE